MSRLFGGILLETCVRLDSDLIKDIHALRKLALLGDLILIFPVREAPAS